MFCFCLPSMLSIEKFDWIAYPGVPDWFSSWLDTGSANDSVADEGARGSTLNKSSEL